MSITRATTRLKTILGDYDIFIAKIQSSLVSLGINPLERHFEMDHLCYRCETVQQYQQLIQQLVPEFGESLIESMIGGRPITTIKFHQKLESDLGYSIPCLEIPAPKAGRSYPQGLEHVEFVIGQKEDGCNDTQALTRFIDGCKDSKLTIADKFNYDAMNKSRNADVSVSFDGVFCVKFHQRPLYEVIELELKEGDVVKVPDGYFKEALKREQAAL